MHNITQILEQAFIDLNTTEVVEKVDKRTVPYGQLYHEIWNIETQVTISEAAEDLHLTIAFSQAFPYRLPDIYYFDTKYDPIPHIGPKDRKLCLYEDGASYSIEDPFAIIKDAISKAKRLIYASAKRLNLSDFEEEIISYWNESYDKESEVDDSYLIWGNLPSGSCTLETWDYFKPKFALEDSRDYPATLVVPVEYNYDELERYLGTRNKVLKGRCIFSKSTIIPKTPPYSCTVKDIIDWTKDEEDRKKIIQEINSNTGCTLFFPLGESNSLAGVRIRFIKYKTDGFRAGKKTPYLAWTEFEKKNQFLERLLCRVYSSNRIAQRTNGRLMNHRDLCIAGLGSIGSNLCSFLFGHNNTSFTVVDRDTLTVDNIGRHLLGFNYLGNNKALALCDHFKNVRPDADMTAICGHIEDYVLDPKFSNKQNTALFVCTGDQMSEIFVIDSITNGTVTCPVFFLWLEPYGIAGHMVYINPADNIDVSRIFNENGLYVNNLIEDEEYIAKSNTFTERDAGCNGRYALYSGNDVTLLLSVMYPEIENLLEHSSCSKFYRWIGNINLAQARNIKLKQIENLERGKVEIVQL